ncbi:MAG: hypothetical protein GX335_07440, partial [Firmicutes bacterium]|nr:hypothetical protein [Bacillota bacterium]
MYWALRRGSSDQRDKLNEVKTVLKDWITNDQIINAITAADMKSMRKRDNPLAKFEQNRVMRIIAEMVETAGEWVALIEEADDSGRNWKHEHIERLASELKKYIPPAISELKREAKNGQIKQRIGLNFVRENLQLLLQFITEPVHNFTKKENWYFRMAEDNMRYCDNIEEVLAKRLFWFPKLALLDNGLPTQGDLEILSRQKMTPNSKWFELQESTYRDWLSKQDQRFLGLISMGLTADEDTKDSLRTMAAKELKGSQDALRLRIQDTTGNIEKALFNGVISENERVGFVSTVESIEAFATLNFAKEISKLKRVDEELNRATAIMIAHLTELWNDLSPQLGKIATPERAERFRALVNLALAGKDTRVVDEYLAKIREHLTENKELKLVEKDTVVRDYLMEFSKFRGVLNHGGNKKFSDALDAVRQGKQWTTLNYGQIPEKQLKQTEDAFNAWRNLRLQKKKLFRKSIKELFTFLGFTVLETTGCGSLEPNSSGYHHLRLKMDASDQARPFPQFGSLAQPTFDVLMVWERPGADNIGSAIYEAKLKGQSSILLYFGRIGLTARQRITRMTRKRRMALAILDETLFLYLTGERDARLRAFLRCAVPY